MENSKRSIRHTLRPSPTAILNPRCDPIFKAIFTQGTEKSNFALKDLISSLLGREVAEMELLPNEEPVEILDEKQMSFDVNVTFDDGEKAELEMQGRNQDYDYASRAEIHAAKLLSSSNKRGSSYDSPKVYQISVLNFEMDKDDNSPVSWYTVMLCLLSSRKCGKDIRQLTNSVILGSRRQAPPLRSMDSPKFFLSMIGHGSSY